MSILLMIGFFRAIPKDLEDACSIDGYGPLGFLFKMVLPLSTPILATTAVITLVASWNNFFLPLLVFNEQAKFTLPLGVMNFQGQQIGIEGLVLQGMDQLVVSQADHGGLLVGAVDDARQHSGTTQAAARTFPRIAPGVITSYSIHYTKLYDTLYAQYGLGGYMTSIKNWSGNLAFHLQVALSIARNNFV